MTFPGTVASLRQMWGRAGRRGRGLAVYVAGEDALDQFFCRHPDEFLDRPVEAAILDHENEQIHAAHLLCAAHEGPLEPADAEYLGPRWQTTAERLVAAGDAARAARTAPTSRAHPDEFPAAARVAALGEPRRRRDRRHRLRRADRHRRRRARVTTTHEGAIYLHGGRQFEVAELDLDARRALVQPFEGDWYTQPKRETDTYIERAARPPRVRSA